MVASGAIPTTPGNNHLTERSIVRKLQISLSHGYISEIEYRRLKPIGTETPYMRGSPKIHKPGVPLRPILRMQNSPYHKLARWSVEIFRSHSQSPGLSLHNSFEFANIPENTSLTSHKMFSIDVVSFFTNVPLHDAVDYVSFYLYKHFTTQSH